jgi:GNAT superfamily N-acetyltransferase
MNFKELATDAGQSGWLLALLARTTARLEHMAGLWIFRVNVRSLTHLPDSLSPPKGVTVRLLTEAQLVHHARDPRYCLDSKFIRRAISRGDLAYGAFEEGRLVGYTWRAASTAPFFEGLWINVPQPLVYGYKSYVLPSHRGRGLYAAFAGFADRQSRAVGHPMALALINISNLASLRASAQMGSRKAGYAGYLKLFGRCFTFRTSLVRAIGVEFYTPAREIRAPERGDALVLLNALLANWGSVLSRLRHALLPPAPARPVAVTGNVPG